MLEDPKCWSGAYLSPDDQHVAMMINNKYKRVPDVFECKRLNIGPHMQVSRPSAFY